MLQSIVSAVFLLSVAEAQWGGFGGAGYWPPYGSRPSVPSAPAPTSTDIVTDLGLIARNWGQISVYADNEADWFGVDDIGLPDGCQVEQAHLLQRHAQRFPTAAFDDGLNHARLAQKIKNFTSANPSKHFSGPLSFLNTYEYIMDASYLTGIGATTEFQSGVTFWNRYGRLLFNASVGQLAYNASFPDGSARPKPVLRTTGQSRIWNSQINWALGFFGPSFQVTPDPTLANVTAPFDVVVIPEGGVENNTLASYDSCNNTNATPISELGDLDLQGYISIYLMGAKARLQKYAPSGFEISLNDTYAFQSICAYETNYIGSSDFCNLFTLDEWHGFEHTLDIEYYYDYAYGNPTGRAQGIGYLQELIARLTNQYITSSNSSVNYTIDNNADDFPLKEKFYADFTHDDIIISVLTAMSLDYIKDPPSLTEYPPDPDARFVLSHLTPFGGRLVTEVIGCAFSNPEPVSEHRTFYYPGQYGYEANNAPHKFIRLRVNDGILPLSTIRGGKCGDRSDGLCTLESFLDSQEGAEAAANYQYACFGNYTINWPNDGQDYDGTYNITAASKS